MGITVHYRGTMPDLQRIEEFEDRVLDLVLEFDGIGRIWRSYADHDPSRVIRGMILDLSPGQETTSLLVAPEGWLVPLVAIEAAEKGEFTSPPYCSVKTQFGSIEGHVALIELLTYLKREFIPDLEVIDEGGYWEARDVRSLQQKFSEMRRIINTLGRALESFPLNAEAAEDPEILIARIERIASHVHTVLKRPPEHPPVDFNDSDLDWNEVDEPGWDAFYKQQRRKQEGLHRAIEEQRKEGVDHNEAFENALRSEGIVDLPFEDDDANTDTGVGNWDELEDVDDDIGESWKDGRLDDASSEEGTSVDAFPGLRHPLQLLAADVSLRIFKLFEDTDKRSSAIDTLMGSLGDIGGGLAQALGIDPPFEIHEPGLSIVQLKRALRGCAFAMGALYPLRAADQLQPEVFEELMSTLQEIQGQILQELKRIRGQETE